MSDRLDWKRLGIGGLTVLLALAGLLWVGRVCRAEYRFRIITRQVKAEGLDIASLANYSLELKKLTQADPANPEIRNRYASVLGKLGDYETAVRELEIARKVLNTRNSLFFLADMYEKMNKIPEAEQAMADCLLLNPTDIEFNPGQLHLLGMRLYELNHQKKGERDEALYNSYRKRFGEAALGWSIRANNDKNAYLFLGNFYLDPLYGPQAYRCFLVGLSGAPWLNLNPKSLVDERGVLGTVRRIIDGRYARPHKGLP